jgi:alpha-beta hydrolase superfamily lysophospholipase
MLTNDILESVKVAPSHELVFAGDGVRLAGQIDYPTTPRRGSSFPLVFVLHHAGSDDRTGYTAFADMALDSGYAVFRWDKRGTGRSGAGGRGSTTQDAVNAYEIALEQPYIDRKRAVILAQDAGTGLLGSSFGLFARVQHPQGVILATNRLDEEAVLAIEAPTLIVVGQHDWKPWQRFGRAAATAHNTVYRYGASYYVAPYADRMLIDPRTGLFHFGAQKTIMDWLAAL